MKSKKWLASQTFDRDLVLEFFILFSRLEFALKKSGFAKADRYENAQPNWDDFESKIRDQFKNDSSSELKNAVSTLITNQPKRQAFVDGKITWECCRQKSDREAQIIECLKTIRNNLFHGGKYPFTPIDEPARNYDLLAAGIVVLNALAQYHPAVSKNFFDND